MISPLRSSYLCENSQTMRVLLKIICLLVPFIMHNRSTGQISEKLHFPDSKITSVDGLKIHYRYFPSLTDSLRGSVMLVHGFAGSTFSWRYITDTLQKSGYEIVAVDVPPFGYSDKSHKLNQSFTARATLLNNFINNTFPKRKWHLVGHSLGGGIVQTLAISAPKSVISVTLVDGLIFSHLETDALKAPWIIRSGFNRGLLLITLKPVLVNRVMLKRFVASAYGRKPTKEETMGYLRPLKIKGTSRAILKSAACYRELFPVESGIISVPVLAFWGDRDKWVPSGTYLPVVEKMPDVKIVFVKGAAHCPMETHPDEFIEVLMKFLTENNIEP